MSLENPTSHSNFNANVRLTLSQSGNLHGDISNSIDEQIKFPINYMNKSVTTRFDIKSL